MDQVSQVFNTYPRTVKELNCGSKTIQNPPVSVPSKASFEPIKEASGAISFASELSQAWGGCMEQFGLPGFDDRPVEFAWQSHWEATWPKIAAKPRNQGVLDNVGTLGEIFHETLIVADFLYFKASRSMAKCCHFAKWTCSARTSTWQKFMILRERPGNAKSR